MNQTSNLFLATHTSQINTTAAYNSTSNLHPYYDPVAVIVYASILLSLLLFGMIANGLTIYVIGTTSNLRSAFNYTIISLCVSDFISAMISPLHLYRIYWGLYKWEASIFLCKVMWAVEIATSIVTSLHIMCFALFRLFSMACPHQQKRIKAIHGKVIIIAIWIIATGSGFVPYAIWFRPWNYEGTMFTARCTASGVWYPQVKVYVIVGYAVFFYVPMLVIMTSSAAAISLMLIRRKRRLGASQAEISSVLNERKAEAEARRQQRENKAMLQLGLIVGAYIFGYLPGTAYALFVTFLSRMNVKSWLVRWWFWMIAHMCLRLSECLNPIFYNFASSSIREETLATLKKIRKCSTPTQLIKRTSANPSRSCRASTVATIAV